MKDLEKVQKTLSDVFDYLKGNNLQLVGKELLTDVGDAHRIVENLAIHGVSTRYSYSEIEERLKSQIDYMIQCVQDSEGTIDPSEDINDIEITLKVLKLVYNVC